MRVVPQAFYKSQQLDKIMVDGLCCIVAKKVNTADHKNERYLASHAITLILRGGLRIESFDGNYQNITKNQLVFLPKGLYMITDLVPDKDPFEALVFFFDDALSDIFLSYYEQKGDQVVGEELLVFEYNEDLRLFTDSLISLFRGKSAHQFTRSKLVEFLHLITLTANGEQFVKSLKAVRKLDKKSIVEFMESHFDKPLDIEDYAYLTGRSISTFQRDFKRRYAQSPKQWLIDRRLQKAAKLLSESQTSITQTVREVGYENTSHFIKSFHKKFGISPKQYQLRHRRQLEI